MSLSSNSPKQLGTFFQSVWPTPLVCSLHTRLCTISKIFIKNININITPHTLASIASWMTSTISSTCAISKLFLPAIPISRARNLQMVMDWQSLSPFQVRHGSWPQGIVGFIFFHTSKSSQGRTTLSSSHLESKQKLLSSQILFEPTWIHYKPKATEQLLLWLSGQNM